MLAGTGDLGFNGDGFPGRLTRLASPTSVLVDPQGRPVVVDFSNMRVRVIEPDGTLETIAGNGMHAYSEEGLDRLESPLENPVDATYGPDGRLYILPMHEGRVIFIDDQDRIDRCACTGELGDGGDGGPSLDARMGYGGGLAFAPDGTLYVSDNTYSRVRRFGLDGIAETVLGTGKAGLGSPGPGTAMEIRSPERLVVDVAHNRLLVADTGNHRVLALDLDTLDAVVLAGTGEAGFSGDGGPATLAQLSSPTGLEVGPDGGVLVSDLGNDVVRYVSPDGEISTVLGTRDGGDPIDQGLPLEFPVLRPAGMAWTPSGDLLVAERSGHRILHWEAARDAL